MTGSGMPPREDLGSPRSQSSTAYAVLKADLLAGRLPPGDRLKVNDLAARLRVSPGAIREGLSRLPPENLVVARDQQGFSAAPVSVADLHDPTDLRCGIEAVALRRAAIEGDSGWEADVLAANHRLRRTPRILEDQVLNPQWSSRHEAFHLALVQGCGSPRLIAVHTALFQQSERYRVLSYQTEPGRDVEAEHGALVDAALDRDADRLVLLATSHLRTTTHLMLHEANRETVPVTG